MRSLYIFLLGVSSGIAVLPLTAYCRVSPRWLKWLLVGSGMLMISRYLTMMLLTNAEAPHRFWWLRHCWFASSIGLTLPSLFALDQLLRHPAISPKKLLWWLSPFLLANSAVMLFADVHPVADG